MTASAVRRTSGLSSSANFPKMCLDGGRTAWSPQMPPLATTFTAPVSSSGMRHETLCKVFGFAATLWRATSFLSQARCSRRLAGVFLSQVGPPVRCSIIGQ